MKLMRQSVVLIGVMCLVACSTPKNDQVQLNDDAPTPMEEAMQKQLQDQKTRDEINRSTAATIDASRRAALIRSARPVTR